MKNIFKRYLKRGFLATQGTEYISCEITADLVKGPTACVDLHDGKDSILLELPLRTPEQRNHATEVMQSLIDALMDFQVGLASEMRRIEAEPLKPPTLGTIVPWTGSVTYTTGLPSNVKIIKTDTGWILGARDGLPPITDYDPGDEND